MNPSLSLLRRTQLIKFVGGRHPRIATNNAIMPHPMSNGIVPGGQGTLKLSSVTRKSTPILNSLQSELPNRFRSKIITDEELEQINSGAATTLF